jgi:hypothetical protein
MHPVRILDLPTGLRMTLGVGRPLPPHAAPEEPAKPTPPPAAPPAQDA